MENVVRASLTQVVGQFAVLIVYLTGIVLALIFWSRHRRPSACTLIASLLLLLTTVGLIVVQNYLFVARHERDWTHEQLSRMLSLVSLFGSAVRASAMGLMLVAIFIDRSQATSPPSHNADDFAD